jgi:nitroreductase
MMLSAAERGIAACMLGAIDRDGLRDAIGLDPRYNIALVLALGKPAETIVLDEVPADGNTKYWRDGESVHHVPKRTLKEIVIN